MIYTGSDDGYINVTKDGGTSWERISDNLPQNLWVTRVVASKHKESRVYATYSGYKSDHYMPYLFKSDDYGVTWTKLGKNLPIEVINVVREDPVNENIIYVGNNIGLFISLNGGKTFEFMNGSIPNVSVFDIKIHPRENDLIVGTHGRSVYIASVKELQQLDENVLASKIKLFEIDEVRYSSRWGRMSYKWSEARTPKLSIPFYVNATGKINLKVMTDDNHLVNEQEVSADKGLNYFTYNLNVDEDKLNDYNSMLEEKSKEDNFVNVKKSDDGNIYLRKGKYKVIVEFAGTKSEQKFEIK